MTLAMWWMGNSFLSWLLAWELLTMCSGNAGSCGVLTVTAFLYWLYEGQRYPTAEGLLQLLFQIPGCLATGYQWHLQTSGSWHLSLLKHPSNVFHWQHSSTKTILGKAAWILWGEKKSEILPMNTLPCIFIKTTNQRAPDTSVREGLPHPGHLLPML